MDDLRSAFDMARNLQQEINQITKEHEPVTKPAITKTEFVENDLPATTWSNGEIGVWAERDRPTDPYPIGIAFDDEQEDLIWLSVDDARAVIEMLTAALAVDWMITTEEDK